jgi:5-methylcytosine-specific restriction enzyme A
MTEQSARWRRTARWLRLRRQQLQRQPLCVFCTSAGRGTAATVADHVVPHRGDEKLFWFGKLQSLCAPCHDTIKRQQEVKGFTTAVGADGWPVDQNHPVNRKHGVAR